MNKLIERAKQSVDYLDSLIKRLNGDAILRDGPAQSLDSPKKVSTYGVPKELVVGCEVAVIAVLEALRSKGRLVRPHSAGNPPEWWSKARAVAEQHRLPTGSARADLIDTLAVLDCYVENEYPRVAGLAFLIGDLDVKIKRAPASKVFRAVNHPNANHFIYFFDPDIHNDVDQTVQNALNERVFRGDSCVPFFESVLYEVDCLK